MDTFEIVSYILKIKSIIKIKQNHFLASQSKDLLGDNAKDGESSGHMNLAIEETERERELKVKNFNYLN